MPLFAKMTEAVLQQLEQQGWYLNHEFVQKCQDEKESRASLGTIVAAALDTDLKQIGRKWMTEEVCFL